MTREQQELVAEALRLLLRAAELGLGQGRQEQAEDPAEQRKREETEARLKAKGLL